MNSTQAKKTCYFVLMILVLNSLLLPTTMFWCFDGSLHFFHQLAICFLAWIPHMSWFKRCQHHRFREKDGLCSLVGLLGLRHRLQGLRLLFGQLLAILLGPMGWWKEAKKDGGKQKCPKSSSNFQERWVSTCDVACFLAVKMQMFRKMSVKRCYEHWTHHWRPHWNSLIWKPPLNPWSCPSPQVWNAHHRPAAWKSWKGQLPQNSLHSLPFQNNPLKKKHSKKNMYREI